MSRCKLIQLCFLVKDTDHRNNKWHLKSTLNIFLKRLNCILNIFKKNYSSIIKVFKHFLYYTLPTKFYDLWMSNSCRILMQPMNLSPQRQATPSMYCTVCVCVWESLWESASKKSWQYNPYYVYIGKIGVYAIWLLNIFTCTFIFVFEQWRYEFVFSLNDCINTRFILFIFPSYSIM